MAGRYLLDSNIAIAVLEGEIDLEERRRTAESLFLVATVIGELAFGAHNSSRPEANLARVEDLAQRCPVLPCDYETVLAYGVVRQKLRKKGRPIPENDMWIAAAALRHGLRVVTRDAHFAEVEGVVEHW